MYPQIFCGIIFQSFSTTQQAQCRVSTAYSNHTRCSSGRNSKHTGMTTVSNASTVSARTEDKSYLAGAVKFHDVMHHSTIPPTITFSRPLSINS